MCQTSTPTLFHCLFENELVNPTFFFSILRMNAENLVHVFLLVQHYTTIVYFVYLDVVKLVCLHECVCVCVCVCVSHCVGAIYYYGVQ